MSKLILFLSVFLIVGCASSKTIQKDTTYSKVVTSRIIDTTLKVINPIQGIHFEAEYERDVVIDAPAYTLRSRMNFETGLRSYEVIPKVDSISIPVKVKEKIITETTVKSKRVYKKYTCGLLALYFAIAVMSGAAGYIVVKILKVK